jgi:uncharacterized coiled-coil protein SlyX
MTDRNAKRAADRIKYLEIINANQAETIERLQRETAQMQRQIEIFKGKAR